MFSDYGILTLVHTASAVLEALMLHNCLLETLTTILCSPYRRQLSATPLHDLFTFKTSERLLINHERASIPFYTSTKLSIYGRQPS